MLGYFRHPTICNNNIAFISEDDIWTVNIENNLAAYLLNRFII